MWNEFIKPHGRKTRPINVDKLTNDCCSVKFISQTSLCTDIKAFSCCIVPFGETRWGWGGVHHKTFELVNRLG